MEKERLTLPWKITSAFSAVLCAIVFGFPLYAMVLVNHDKSINTELGILWDNPRGVPLGVVQPAHNHWMKHAFVADASADQRQRIAVLILDDHYRSEDSLYRSASGVIGDHIGKAVLCSVPKQAQTKNVVLDPVVQQLVAAECH